MSGNTVPTKVECLDTALDGVKLEDESSMLQSPTLDAFQHGHLEAAPTPQATFDSQPPTPASSEPHSMPRRSRSGTPGISGHEEAKLGSEVTLKVENGKPKLSRKASQKVFSRPAPLFDDLPDSTDAAIATFQVIRDCIYGSKYMGSSEHEALGCDCTRDMRDGANHACGEDSDCINRATKMECIDDECNCGEACQNQRFQRKQFANVSVIKTDKKGFGLRADADLQPGDFIFEYIGEVINEPTFRRRMVQYDQEGFKHFYFMSLTKSEFVDATKKGNLGRFCNHSCNPNCYVDKWVVGDKLRMGIFAERFVRAGEELVFNYNVDRYGADPQPCYCNEPNCTGFIGGKTQTERATKLSHATIEALGIDDGDGWDVAVAKKPRKKKTGEDDEEYVSQIQPKGLDEDGVKQVMATLMQCKEKWIAVKVLGRIQRCDDDRVRNRVVRMHGYNILRTMLNTFNDDNNIVLQILDILYKFPRLTKNKIADSKIEAALEQFKNSEHDDVKFESCRLLEQYDKLETAYRIPRQKFNPANVSVFERREAAKEEVVVPVIPTGPSAPTGPRSHIPQRAAPRFNGPARSSIVRRPFGGPLPSGWFTAVDQSGNTYYYSKAGATTWQRPTIPAVEKQDGPKAPPKAVQDRNALQDIIDSFTKNDVTLGTPSTATPNAIDTPRKEKKVEKWRSYPVEKQMKIYENTLFPHVKYVMDKFRHKLPKDDLKTWAKAVSKKLVASDFKNKRVTDPTKITEKQEKKIKAYVKDYFDAAVEKKRKHDKARKTKIDAALAAKAVDANGTNGSVPSHAEGEDATKDKPTAGEDEHMIKAEESDIEPDLKDEDDMADITMHSPSTYDNGHEHDHDLHLDHETDSLKRKRSPNSEINLTPTDLANKRIKDEPLETTPSPTSTPEPPPPPPPPAYDMPEDLVDYAEGEETVLEEDSQQRELREQEEALQRENEEAMREAMKEQSPHMP